MTYKPLHRKKLPRSRNSHTHTVTIDPGGNPLVVTMTVGEYEDGSPGEVFIRSAKTGSTINGLLDSVALMVSHALQHGMPIAGVVRALKGNQYMPDGQTDDPDVPVVCSVTDYVGQKLEKLYCAETLD